MEVEASKRGHGTDIGRTHAPAGTRHHDLDLRHAALHLFGFAYSSAMAKRQQRCPIVVTMLELSWTQNPRMLI
ncbi:hypothetical protein D3C87_1823710 [compost metagenome]